MNKSRLTTIAAVALMLIVPLTVYTPASDADDGPFWITDFPSYGYILTMADGQVGDVKAYTGSYSETYATKNGLNDWSFTDGIGPFNSFYAAINLADTTETCTESRISTAPGQVAYILDPDDLSRTFNGGTYTGSYNIMFVIPTVYWYADGNVLYLSNTPGFFGDLTVVGGQQQMKAYAHTVSNSTGSSAQTYDLLCIGVYEGSFLAGAGTGNNAIMVSQSGNNPATQRTLDGFRINVLNNTATDGAKYGLWNFYHWTLYKMMSYTVMDNKDSKGTVGNGVVSKTGVSISTGTMDQSGWFSGSYDLSTGSKLFIENSWGNVWEYLDNTYMSRNGELHAGDGLGSGINIATAPNQASILAGMDHINGQVSIVDTYGYAKLNYYTSTSPLTWDLPVSEAPNTHNNPSDDPIETNHGRTVPAGIWVGGSRSWYNSEIQYGGLSSLSATGSINFATIQLGARLVYVLDYDAAGLYGISYVTEGNGTVSGPALAPIGEMITLITGFESGWKLTGLHYSYNTGSGVYGGSILRSGTFVMPEYPVTVYATFEPIITVTVVAEPPGGSISADPEILSFDVTLGSAYITHNNVLTIFDSDGTSHTLTSVPATGHYHYVFIDESYNVLDRGVLGKDTVISAKYVTWIPGYTVEFYETSSRITALYVEAGDKVMMPEPLAQDGKEFRGWYSSDAWEQSSYVGPHSTYYEPTGPDETVRLYAYFVDSTAVVQSLYPVTCLYVLDGGSASQSSSIVDALFAESISPLSTGVLVITQNAVGYYEHTVTASNATVTKINATTWIYSNATGPVMLTINSETVTDRAVEALYIAGVAGDGTGVRVKIDPLTAAGLPSGRVTVKGIVFQNFSNGFVGYANLSFEVGNVAEGQSSYDVTVSDFVEPGFRLYYVYVLLEYGTYDSLTDSYSNEQVSVAIMAPATSL